MVSEPAMDWHLETEAYPEVRFKVRIWMTSDLRSVVVLHGDEERCADTH